MRVTKTIGICLTFACVGLALSHSGDLAGAAAAYRRALELATTAAERRFIARRLEDHVSPAKTS